MLNEPDESSVIKAVSAEIDLGIATLDAYMLPNAEKRQVEDCQDSLMGRDRPDKATSRCVQG